MDGILNVDKPSGLTSMEVVRRVKRATGQRHVGHGGTLDPYATGVLPVFLGQATRLMEYLVESTKHYLAVVHLGVTTDTYDLLGRVVEEHDASAIGREAVDVVLATLRGTIEQTPPMYSALKREGRRLYELARAGQEVERPARKVQVLRLELVGWRPPSLELNLECSRGFYVRSLAHDLGQRLGCGAHLSALRRTRTGPFTIEQAVPLERVEEAFAQHRGESLLLPPDYTVLHLRPAAVTPEEERRIRNGQTVPLTPRTHYARHLDQCRAYTQDGRFLALLRFHRPLGLWQPFKVFPKPMPSPYARETHPVGQETES
ncbi:MAG: tRNA pseudouridine(55) synthase TruB [Chloroflexi bacterium]|nr:tRNA pseudouridine(55) synthase TruB [Chloroflexota bacterium]